MARARKVAIVAGCSGRVGTRRHRIWTSRSNPPHRRRLAYDELLAHQLALAARKGERRAVAASVVPRSDLSARAEAALPFRLTGAQTRTLMEIGGDLASGRRMTRLIQGDVGSGKTVVAMLAMIDVAAAGGQSVLMAPH